MSKIKSNNYDQAIKEIKSMDAELVNRIPETIDDKDSKHYHVALVRITDRPGQPKNDVNVNVQMFNGRAFEKISKNFVFQGFAKLSVIHDPTKKSEPAKEPSKETTTAKTTNVGTDDTANGKNDGKTPENDSTPSESEKLEKEFQFAIGGNKPELIAFAEKHGVDLSEATNNDLRVDAITAWFNVKMDELSKQ